MKKESNYMNIYNDINKYIQIYIKMNLLWRNNNTSNTTDISVIPVKKSYGIILCKINSLNNRFEVLLVHKRYTYSYSIFIHGKYSRPNIWPRSSMQFIINLLNQMTLDELLDIWSLDFKQMWYRIWLNNNSDTELYKRKYTKFYMSFIKNDNGEGLQKIIQQVRNYATLNYECPKGRPLDSNETNIACAIREIKEETGLTKSDYTILPNVKRYVNYVSLGTRYICTYYIAIINPSIKYYNNSIFKNITNINEVNETKWFDIEKIRVIDDYKKHLESLISSVFKLIKKYNKGKWINNYRYLKESIV
jgi:ADP-ribose pyrophosphatase YjhB (NUDIX family)